jgi:hypothetical protein
MKHVDHHVRKFRVCHQSRVMTYTNLLQHYTWAAKAVHRKTQSWGCTETAKSVCVDWGGTLRHLIPDFGTLIPDFGVILAR